MSSDIKTNKMERRDIRHKKLTSRGLRGPKLVGLNFDVFSKSKKIYWYEDRCASPFIPGADGRVFIIITSSEALTQWKDAGKIKINRRRISVTCAALAARPCSAAPASSSWGSWEPLSGRCRRPSRSTTSRLAPRWPRQMPGPRRGPSGPADSHWGAGQASAGLISVIDLLSAGTCLRIESNFRNIFS